MHADPARRRRTRPWLALALAGLAAAAAAAPPRPARNVVIFVADGLRHGSVEAAQAPAFQSVRSRGVDFVNSHSLFPTLTTANASAIATGHQLGDTGDFANTLYTGFAVFDDGRLAHAPGSVTPFLENDAVLADVNAHTGGNYLVETSLLALARRHGFNTAAIGKLGPVAIQDVGELAPLGGRVGPTRTVIVDDATGGADGVPIDARLRAALSAAGLPAATPRRRQPAGDLTHAGTHDSNVEQQRWFIDVATRAVLPMFAADRRPFLIVYWSRDPDGSQHNQGDSLNSLVPGINGPTSRAGVLDADQDLGRLLAAIAADPKLARTTDVIVTSDHGFSVISKHAVDASGRASAAYAASLEYRDATGRADVHTGWLPPGFLAIDLAHALGMALYDPDTRVQRDGYEAFARVEPGTLHATHEVLAHPVGGNGLLGGSGLVGRRGESGGATDAALVVAANGGSDLLYLRNPDRSLARRIVDFLAHQDYVDGLFADASLGDLPGTLPLEAIGLAGGARLPRPSLVVAFKTFATDPADPVMSQAQVSDTTLQEGQGMHGSLGRGDTFNCMAAVGPDFRRGFQDDLPVGNADIAPTLATLLHLPRSKHGALGGRVLWEALARGAPRVAGSLRPERRVAVSAPSVDGFVTVLEYQRVGGRRYLDRACARRLPAGDAHRGAEDLDRSAARLTCDSDS